jgi:tetratricopeptide (TPR) repeat protein
LEEERALALSMRGVALSALGRREEALAAAQEAAELYRRLAAQQPDANSLETYGIALYGLTREWSG